MLSTPAVLPFASDVFPNSAPMCIPSSPDLPTLLMNRTITPLPSYSTSPYLTTPCSSLPSPALPCPIQPNRPCPTRPDPIRPLQVCPHTHGISVRVEGYPSSPWRWSPFTRPYAKPAMANVSRSWCK